MHDPSAPLGCLYKAAVGLLFCRLYGKIRPVVHPALMPCLRPRQAVGRLSLYAGNFVLFSALNLATFLVLQNWRFSGTFYTTGCYPYLS